MRMRVRTGRQCTRKLKHSVSATPAPPPTRRKAFLPNLGSSRQLGVVPSLQAWRAAHRPHKP